MDSMLNVHETGVNKVQMHEDTKWMQELRQNKDFGEVVEALKKWRRKWRDHLEWIEETRPSF